MQPIKDHGLGIQVSFTNQINLASASLGAQVLYANDEFFAEKENLIKDSQPVFEEGRFTDNGKWMDGWETRRKRGPGHDWCVVKLPVPGLVSGILVDTSYFVGNYPEFCALDGLDLPSLSKRQILQEEPVDWQELLPRSQLRGGSHNYLAMDQPRVCNFLRFRIFPDGGVARLRVYGSVIPDWQRLRRDSTTVDLASVLNGGRVIGCSDMFFGSREYLLMPGRAKTMGEGWETRRRRGAGHDWIVVKLGHEARLTKLEIDTHHFKGNYPDTCAVHGARVGDRVLTAADIRDDETLTWVELLGRSKLSADKLHTYGSGELAKAGREQVFDHLRLSIYPDGGISRFRVYGDFD